MGSIIGFGGGNPLGAGASGGLLGGISGGFAALGSGLSSLVGGSGALGAFAGGLQAASLAGTAGAASIAGSAAAAGSFSTALGAAIPVIGQIAAVAGIINSVTGGRLFGTSFKPTGNTSQTLTFSDAGFSGTNFTEESRRRSIFSGGGTRTRNVASALDAQALAGGTDFVAQARAQLQADAELTGRNFVGLLSAEFKRSVDKNGKVLAEGGTIAGTYYAENFENFQARLVAESRINQLGDEASQIAARWRAGASDIIASGSEFLVAASAAIQQRITIAGDSLLATTELTEELAKPNEALGQTFARLVSNNQLLQSALDATGIVARNAGADFTRFSTAIVEDLGGIQNASQIIGNVVNSFFTEAERQEQLRIAARRRAESLAGAAGFTGIVSNQDLRPVVQQALAGEINAERATAVLAYASAIADFNRLVVENTEEITQQQQQQQESNRRLVANYESTIAAINQEIAQVPRPLTLRENIRAINEEYTARVRALREGAVAAGLSAASETDLANARIAADRRIVASYRELEARVSESIRQLYPPVDRLASLFNESGIAVTSAGVFRREQQVDPARFTGANEIAASIRQLAEVNQQSVFGLADKFGLPLFDFLKDFGVDFSRIFDPAEFDDFVAASRALGVDLPDFADRIGIEAGKLSNANSAINDGFERALTRITGTDQQVLTGLLRSLESATDDQQRTAITGQIESFISGLDQGVQQLFAPFLSGIKTTSADDAQTGYLQKIDKANEESVGLLRELLTASKPLIQPPDEAVRAAIVNATQAQSRQATDQLIELQALRAELAEARRSEAENARSLERILSALARG